MIFSCNELKYHTIFYLTNTKLIANNTNNKPNINNPVYNSIFGSFYPNSSIISYILTSRPSALGVYDWFPDIFTVLLFYFYFSNYILFEAAFFKNY